MPLPRGIITAARRTKKSGVCSHSFLCASCWSPGVRLAVRADLLHDAGGDYHCFGRDCLAVGGSGALDDQVAAYLYVGGCGVGERNLLTGDIYRRSLDGCSAKVHRDAIAVL